MPHPDEEYLWKQHVEEEEAQGSLYDLEESSISNDDDDDEEES